MAQYPAGAAAAAKLPVTKSNTQGQQDLRGVDSSTPVSANGGSGSYGSWVQYAASLSSDTILTAISVRMPSAIGSGDVPMLLQVGIGGAGSETVVHEGAMVLSGNQYGQGEVPVRIPVRIASGQRVAVRIYTGTATSTYPVFLFGVPYANMEGN